MKAKIQVYTAKGFYGPPKEIKIRTLSEVGKAVLSTADTISDQIEDQKFLDWTKIEITVERN